MVEQWSSELEKSKQTYIALSTAEAEYVTLASTSQEVIWMSSLGKASSEQVEALIEITI